MARCLGPSVVLLVLAACDPMAPGVHGTLSAAPGVDVSRYRTLEVRFEPTRPDPGGEQPDTRSIPVGELQLPTTNFWVGGGVGTSNVPTWRLRVWLTEREGAPPGPEPGEPRFEGVFDFGDCARGCENIRNIPIVVAPGG